MLNRLLIFFMLGIWIVGDSSKGISSHLLEVEETIQDGVRLALTEQQKKEMFLKAREDLFPTPPATEVVSPSGSSEAENKKERNAEFAEEASLIREKKINPNTSRSKKHSKRAGVSQSKDGGSQRGVKSPSKRGNDSDSTSNSKIQHGAKNQKTSQNESESKKKSEPNRKNESTTSQTFGDQTQSQIRIIKSGYQADEGLMPLPPQTSGRGARFRYLTPAVRRAIDRASVKRGRWKYIIVHNSGTRQGNARIFDIYHRRIRHMQNGLAYHFVIGNGRSSGNGQIEVGHRWQRQINGGHVASDYLNNIAIGICLVGDYNRDVPTPQQLVSLEELISYLQRRVGRYKGRLAIVLGHREINPKPTDCPGRRFPLRWLHQKFPNR